MMEEIQEMLSPTLPESGVVDLDPEVEAGLRAIIPALVQAWLANDAIIFVAVPESKLEDYKAAVKDFDPNVFGLEGPMSLVPDIIKLSLDRIEFQGAPEDAFPEDAELRLETAALSALPFVAFQTKRNLDAWTHTSGVLQSLQNAGIAWAPTTAETRLMALMSVVVKKTVLEVLGKEDTSIQVPKISLPNNPGKLRK